LNPFDLINIAVSAEQYARAKYSNFKVGAALLTSDGKVYKGCNIESSSYGLTICAERVALYNAIADGQNTFISLALTNSNEEFCPPCGACRQVLFDYAPDLQIIIHQKGNYQIFSITELLPQAFTDSHLKNNE
jgi:cytidine deaminase